MRLRFSLLLIAALLTPATASAIVVLPKGSTKPVMGYVVRQDDKIVVVREVLPDGKSREQSFQRDQIDELLITVSPERLAELDPAKPQLYREYAEELAEKHRDPEARDMALRLYHMAAVLGEGNLRRGSLLGLAALARSPQEERKFRAAAFLYDPDHDFAALAGAREVKLTRSTASPEHATELLSALRLIRQGKGPQAKVIVQKPDVHEQLEGLAKIITAEELLATCTSKPLTDAQLLKLLRAELAVEHSLGNSAAGSGAEDLAQPERSWTAAVKSRGLSPLPSLDLDTLTEFEPRACLFRDGKWVRP